MELVKFTHAKISIKTDNKEFSKIRLNDLLLLSDGELEIVVTVESITNNESEIILEGENEVEDMECPFLKRIECSILGSVIDGKFKQQIERYPTADVKVKNVSDDEFRAMIDGSPKGWFCIGKFAEHDTGAWINGNKFYQRHACIVGNTGSGKSETLAKILEETAGLPGANIILFDIHGEYSRLSYADNIKIGQGLSFPVWLFGFQDMVSNILKIKEESATVVMSALKKCYRENCPKGNEGKPVRFSYDDIVARIDELNNEVLIDGYFKNGEPKYKNGEYYGKLSGAVSLMRAKRHDVQYSFLFEECLQDYLVDFVNRLLGGDKPVKNIDLSDIPHDVAIPIIGAITKLVFDIQRTTGPDFHPITLVCDEAHVYIPNNFQLSASERRMVEVFEDIAKEGRKFGITLFVASQRPSELNKTIMAQCANFIVGKLNNENDKAMIKGMLPDGNESMIDSATMFSPGDVLVVGDAAPIPLKIHVKLAKERPQSRTIDFWDEWSRQERVWDYSEKINEYLAD